MHFCVSVCVANFSSNATPSTSSIIEHTRLGGQQKLFQFHRKAIKINLHAAIHAIFLARLHARLYIGAISTNLARRREQRVCGFWKVTEKKSNLAALPCAFIVLQEDDHFSSEKLFTICLDLSLPCAKVRLSFHRFILIAHIISSALSR